jgi:hypothetical protein
MTGKEFSSFLERRNQELLVMIEFIVIVMKERGNAGRRYGITEVVELKEGETLNVKCKM